MDKLKGVDISTWQGEINFEELKKHVDFVIIRTVVGKHYDKNAKHNINECYIHKIPYGLYCAAYPLTEKDAVEEARRMAYYARMCKPLFPVYYDYEGFSLDYAKKNGYNHSAETIRTLTRAYCNELEKQGFFAGVYANLNYTKNIYKDSFFKRYSHWLAYWSTSNVCNAPMWQFTSNGNVAGIYGRVDKNICTTNFPKLITQAHRNGW